MIAAVTVSGLMALAGVPVDIADQSNAAVVGVPYLERLEALTSDADGGAGGNGWGGHALRITRTATDDLFVVYPAPGRGVAGRDWVLMHRSAPGVWTEIARDVLGQFVPQTFVRPGNRLQVTGQPGGLPALWDDLGPNGQAPFHQETAPSFTYATDYPYAGAATRPHVGDVIYVYARSGDYSPSAFFWAYRDATTERWSSIRVQPTAYRYLYFLPVMDPRGRALHIPAVVGVPWRTLGYVEPPGLGFGYVRDRVSVFYTGNYVAAPTLTEILIHHERPSYPGEYVDVYASDTYRDTAGRVHVMYYVQGPSTGSAIQGRHAILSGGAVEQDVAVTGVTCPNTTRIFQDSADRFYLMTSCIGGDLHLYPADRRDGTRLGTVVTLSTAPHRPSNWHWLAVPRGGNSIADYVDGIYAADNDRQLVYFRVRLSGAGGFRPLRASAN